MRTSLVGVVSSDTARARFIYYNIIRMRNLTNGTPANVRRALSSFELHKYIAIAGISSARFLEYPASLCGSSDERAAPVVGLLSCASCI